MPINQKRKDKTPPDVQNHDHMQWPQRDKTCLAVFALKLLDHITKTSALDVHFDWMLQRLTERTLREETSALSQTVGNFMIPIYEELCREFESAQLLQADGERSRDDVEMPDIEPASLEPVISFYLSEITDDQWMLLKTGEAFRDTAALISEMCRELIDMLSTVITIFVDHQFQSRMHANTAEEGATSSSNTSVSKATVTEVFIRGSLGESLHHCFGGAMGFSQERSDESEKLLDSVTAEVTRRVNQSLVSIGEGSSSTPSEESPEWEAFDASHTEDMVQHVLRILSCLIREYVEAPLTDQVSPDTSAEELSKEHEDLLSAFLKNLQDHIAHSTKTSIPDVDFDGMLQRLTEGTKREITSTLSQTDENFHIPICKKLCCKFGSAKLLQAAAMSDDDDFEEAAAEILKAQLHKVQRNSCSFFTKVRRFFRERTNDVTPACVTEDTEDETFQSKRRGPAIVRLLSSVGNFIMEPFFAMSGDSLSSEYSSSDIRARYMSPVQRF